MIHVVLRTCNQHSLQSTRIVNKTECILRCLNSIITNLEAVKDKTLHIIDDNSTEDFKFDLQEFVKSYPYITVDFLPPRDQTGLSAKKKSRFSVARAYDYIYTLPSDDLVYIVEDDYLHFPGAIAEMIDTWQYLSFCTQLNIGIFPQDFNQLHYHPDHAFNETYCRPSMIVPARKRYYKTTWFTQESFMIQSKIFKQYREEFDKLLTIGDNEHNWEGNTISNVWVKPDFKMFMPLGSLVVHMSNQQDMPFFITKQAVQELWESNKTPWSTDANSQLEL
jgi:glycosyltransferase involved in cell wall biosynthesis